MPSSLPSTKPRTLRLLPAAWALTLLALLALAPTAPATAQAEEATEEALVTDRPDVTESAETVDPGAWQLEAGVTAERRGEEEAWSWGELLVRTGLAEGWELRLAPGSRERLEAPDGRDRSGWSDGSLGVKVGLAEGGGARPTVALIVDSEVPSGDEEVGGGDGWQPGALVALAWDLGRLGDRPASLGVNLGARRALADGERFDQLSWSLALGLDLGGGWGAYGEVFGLSEEEPGGSVRTAVDAGLTYLLSPDLQLDLRAGTGFGTGGPDGPGGPSADTPDHFVGAGVSWRFGSPRIR